MSNSLLKFFSTGARTLNYRPEITIALGSVTASIYLSQICYWGDKYDGEFYKFKSPCGHRLYTEGDSWTEELGFGLKALNNAEKIILDLELVKKRITIERLSYYSVDNIEMAKFLNFVYSDSTFPKGIYVKSEEEASTFPKESYQNDQEVFCSYTETTPETTSENKGSVKKSLTKKSSNKPKRELTKKDKDLLASCDVKNVPKRLLAKFYLYRKHDIKKPWKTTAGIQGFINKLDELASVEEMAFEIARSIEEEWQTIYPKPISGKPIRQDSTIDAISDRAEALLGGSDTSAKDHAPTANPITTTIPLNLE